MPTVSKLLMTNPTMSVGVPMRAKFDPDQIKTKSSTASKYHLDTETEAVRRPASANDAANKILEANEPEVDQQQNRKLERRNSLSPNHVINSYESSLDRSRSSQHLKYYVFSPTDEKTQQNAQFYRQISTTRSVKKGG